MGWRNLFSSCAVELCHVSFLFWWEIGFGLHTHELIGCGVVLVFWLRQEIVFGVTYILFGVQYSCAVVLVIRL